MKRILNIFSLTNIANLYTLLWLLYYMQGILYSKGGIVGVSIMSIFILISLYLVFKVNQQTDLPILLKVLNVLVLLFTIYGTLRILNPVPIFREGGLLHNPNSFLKTYYISLLPIYSFYYFVRSGKVDADWIKVWTLVFIAFSIVQFHNSELLLIQKMSAERLQSSVLVNNMGYSFVSLMCLIPFFSKNKAIQNILIILFGLFVITSVKRGAILCYSVNTFVFLLYRLRDTPRRKRLMILALVLTCLYVVFSYLHNVISENETLAKLLVMDITNSSGRDVLYQESWNIIIRECNLFKILFGHGADSSIAFLGNYAHNDWLEFALNMGLCGVAVYFVFYIAFAQTVVAAKNDLIRLSLLFLFIPCVMKAIFSMSIGDFQIYETAVLAFSIAHSSKESLTV